MRESVMIVKYISPLCLLYYANVISEFQNVG